MYPFLRVSVFPSVRMSGWTAEGLSPQTNGSLSIWCLGGCTKIKRLQGEKPWELNITSQVRLQAGFLPPGWSVCSSLELPFLILLGNLHHKGGRQLWVTAISASTSSKGLNNGSNGSTNYPYFIVTCPQTCCTEGWAEDKGQDSTADTPVSAHAVPDVWQPVSYTGNCIELHQQNWNLCDGNKIQQI